KHNCWSDAGALVIDLRASVLNKAARNYGRISRYGSLLFLRLAARSYKQASGGNAGEFREIATRDHGVSDQHCRPKCTTQAKVAKALSVPQTRGRIPFRNCRRKRQFPSGFDPILYFSQIWSKLKISSLFRRPWFSKPTHLKGGSYALFAEGL